MGETRTITTPVIAPPIFAPLSGVQTAALDLFQRGLSVFPTPPRWEVAAWAAERPGERDPLSKPPYLVAPFFTTQLHVCGPDCAHPAQCLHLPEGARFESLFSHANLAAMTGRTSGNLLAVDCDSKRAFDLAADSLDKRGLPFWAFTSPRGGAFLMRLAEGEAANLPKDRGRLLDVEIWGNRHYVILPPSVHPLGTVYTWLTPDPYRYLPMGEPPPMVHVDALDWLGMALAVKARNRWEDPELFNLPAWTARLSRRNREFLATGATEGQRNYRLACAAYDMAGCGIDYTEAEAVLLTAAARCTPPYPKSDSRAILKSAYSQTRQPARKGGAHIPKPWQAALEFAHAFDWRAYGRMAQTTRAVFLACCERARLDDSPTFRASERELSELANFGDHKRARRGLRLLTSNAPHNTLIRHVGTSELNGANLYAFSNFVLATTDENVRAHSNPINYHLQYVVGSIGAREKHDIPTTPAEQDVFSRIGPVAWRVWVHLVDRPEPSAAAIARAEKLNPGSTRRALKRLQAHRLVTFGPAEGMYYGESRTDDELERMAANLYDSSGKCVLGKSARRRRQHQAERERRANRLMAKARERWRRRYMAWHESQQ